jgi:ion channel-forming bestrophin family protein
MVSFQSPGSRCHALLGSALGLLLVFRTNSAYNRFWEGRKIWERILTSLRDLGRTTMIYSDIAKSARVERIFHLLCAFPLILQEHVQGFRHPSQLTSLLSLPEIRELDRVTNRPYYILNKISKEIRLIPECPEFSSRERQMMQKYVDDLSRSLGAAERIVQTPVPLTYARHTSRFLSLFCLTAPIALVGELGAYVVPFVTMVAWALFGIQEIGLMIEEPFQRALRLEVFANTIRRDLSDLLHVTNANPTTHHLRIDSEALGYEVPFSCRLDAVSKLLDEKVMTPQEVHKEIERLQQTDSARLHGNDPFHMPIL